ncbi:MAG TPA: hypothetical protein VHG72_18240 [Polyangia bacterium]|nr:hypothetical protein [Polyangia bacterium]
MPFVQVAQDALDGTWLGDGSDDAHSGVAARLRSTFAPAADATSARDSAMISA